MDPVPFPTPHDEQDAGGSRRPPGFLFTLVVLFLGLGLVRVCTPLARDAFELIATLVLTAGIAALLFIRILVGAVGSWRSRHVRISRAPGTVRRWAMPVLFGAGALGAAHSGLARDGVWRYNEPFLRAEAERVLVDNPAPPDSGRRTFGTIRIVETTVEHGRVHFLTEPGVWLNDVELIYCPPRVPGPEISRYGRSLGGGWWLNFRNSS